MLISANGKITAREVAVLITNNSNHDPETWADLCVNRIIQISNSAPPVIRDQALAYKDLLRDVVHYYIREAVRATEAEMLEKFVINRKD